jgi:hypothetical protein
MKHNAPEDQSIGMLEYWKNGIMGNIRELEFRNSGIAN